MTATTAGHVKMSLEEWGDLPEEEAGEYVDGQLVEDEDVGMLHDVVVAWFISVLRAWVAQRGGVVGASDTRFAVAENRGRKPDIFVYFDPKRGRAHGLLRAPPDIAVEVVSPRPGDIRRDRLEKFTEYETFGIHRYWIVDPQLRVVELYELTQDGRYVRAVGATGGALTVPGCDGLSIDLDKLWDEADRIPAEG